ncbi:MAG: hypothetical protein C4560_03145 [Nitrospiraceae bacterium]|nr:MAG: hypothetical protein C4560_03145 [Nitrospiraceae bacterium]
MEAQTTSIQKALDRSRLKPVYIVESTLQGAGAPTLYFSDRNITVGSQIYENYLDDLSGLAEEIERATSEGLNPDIHLRFKNDRFMSHTHLIEIGSTYPFHGAVTIIKEVYLDDDNAFSDVRTIFKGALDQPRDIDELNFTCPVSAMTLVKDKQWKQTMITKAAYPNADPDDIGKYENIIYGSCEKVRCHAIKAGAVDSLAQDIGTGLSAFALSDPAGKGMSSGTITIQIENEQIRGSYSGSTFTPTVRGYNSTTAVAHDKGMAVFEVLSEYVYLVAGHPVKAIGDPYAWNGERWVRQPTGVTKYTGQSGSEHGSYSGKAVIAFSAKPVVKKQVDMTISDPQHQHAASVLIDTVVMNQYTINSGSWTFTTSNIIDNNFNNSAVQDPSSNTDVQRILPYNNGIPSRIRIGINHSDAVYNNIAAVSFYLNGALKQTLNFNGSPSKTTTYSNWYTLSSWSHVNAANTYVNIVTTAGNSFRVWEIWYEVEYDPTTSTGATNTSLSGNSSADAFVGEAVCCDVDGYRDDGSGTYTGSANALIERPDHFYKHFIDILYGFTLTDIDSSSFTAAGTAYAAAISGGYKFGICINEEIVPSQFIYSLAPQCRSNIRYDKGLWKLLYLPDIGPAAVKTISKSSLSGEFSKFSFNWTDNINIANDLKALFKYNYGRLKYDESEWIGTATATDATSQGKYGVRPLTVQFSAVRSQAMADHVLAFILLLRKNPLLTVNFPAFWEYFALERGDTFDIVNSLYNAVKFYIERIGRPEKGIVNITGIQWPG